MRLSPHRAERAGSPSRPRRVFCLLFHPSSVQERFYSREQPRRGIVPHSTQQVIAAFTPRAMLSTSPRVGQPTERITRVESHAAAIRILLMSEVEPGSRGIGYRRSQLALQRLRHPYHARLGAPRCSCPGSSGSRQLLRSRSLAGTFNIHVSVFVWRGWQPRDTVSGLGCRPARLASR